MANCTDLVLKSRGQSFRFHLLQIDLGANTRLGILKIMLKLDHNCIIPIFKLDINQRYLVITP